MEKKYELADAMSINCDGRTFHRIRALRDFGDVKAGDLGGWIEYERNLSHDGNCWVYGEAKVFDGAKVWGDAKVFDRARVSGDAEIYESAWILDDAIVFGESKIYGDAVVSDGATIYNSEVYGNAHVCDHAFIRDGSAIHGCAMVSNHASVRDGAQVCEYASVHGSVTVDNIGVSVAALKFLNK